MRPPRALRLGLAAAALASLAAGGWLAWSRWVAAPRDDAARLGLVAVDLPAPDVDLRSSEGANFVVSEHRGEVLLINFWATWCPPCRQEFPSLVRLAADLAAAHPGRVRVVAISVDEDWAPVREFLGGRVPAGMTVALAPSQQASGPFFCAARGRCPDEYLLPETHLVDPSGRLVGYVAGPRDWSSPEVRRVLERLLE
jgi:thiol-disulfide isomerase/thioredoxin